MMALKFTVLTRLGISWTDFTIYALHKFTSPFTFAPLLLVACGEVDKVE